ncbi:MAG: DUF58 domain-containing protein [Pirellulaceae bacterium]
MIERRRIRICSEGWYYLLVLTFMVGGAVFRQANLLIVLTGLMVAPLLLNWRLTVSTVRRLSLRRRLPSRICAGEPLVVEIELTNHRRTLGGWAMVAQDQIMLEGPLGEEFQTTVDVVFPSAPAGASVRAGYRAELSRRGRYRFGPLTVSSRFPFGLVEAAVQVNRLDEILVCPRIGKLIGHWQDLLESHRDGSRRSQRRRGPLGGDYYGLREFRPGDTVRMIHWRTSAKLGELAVRLLERQRNRDVAVLLDLWHPHEAQPRDFDQVELAVSFAATVVADLCRRGGSRLLIAGGGLESQLRLQPASHLLLNEVLEELAAVQGSNDDRITPVLEQLETALPAGTRRMIVSTRPAPAAAPHPLTSWFDVSDSAELASLFQID